MKANKIAIAAVILGGTSFTGGIGTIIGTLVGFQQRATAEPKGL